MERLIRLYEDFGQSPWLDNLKRGYLTSGPARRPARRRHPRPDVEPDDLPEGDLRLGRLRRAVPHDRRRRRPDRRRLLGPRHGRHRGRLRRARPGVRVERRPRRLRQRRGRARPGQRLGRAPRPAARELHERIARRNLMVKIPATAAGVAPIQQMLSEGRNINVTLIFSLQRYQEVMDAYIAGLEAYARHRRRRPVEGRQRGQLLHLPRRHRGRPAARGHRHARGARPAGQGRRRPGQAGLPAVPRDVLRAPLAGARRPGRPAAAPAVGEHVDEEPGATPTRCTSTS